MAPEPLCYPRMARRETTLLVPLIFVQVACVTTHVAGGGSPSIDQATLSVGERQYRLNSCSSGDLEYFLGVDLADEAQSASVRLVIDPILGPRLRVELLESETTRSLRLGPEQCRQLEAEVRATGWQVNTVRDFSGFVNAECKTDDARAISLHARFSHCH